MRYSRAGHLFDCPILLSLDPTDFRLIAAAGALPPLLAWALRQLVVAPIGRALDRTR